MKNLISNVKRNILYYSAMFLTVAAMSCQKSKMTPNDTPVLETTPTPTTERNVLNPPSSMIARVAMIDKTFSPKVLTIQPNTLVIWTNKDDMPHSIASSDGTIKLESSPLKMGSSFSYRFAQPGTYTYRCGMHDYEEMIGIIYVKATGTETLNPN